MHILIITVKESQFLAPMWQNIIAQRPRDTFSVLCFDDHWKKPRRALTALWLYSLHYGSRSTLKKLINKTLRSQSSPLCGSSKKTFCKLALPKKIPCYHSDGFNPATLQHIKDLSADIILYQTPIKIPSDILSLPRYGVVSRHPSLLPNYRGCFPVFWAHRSMEKTYGVTIFHPSEVYDKGAILIQASFTPNPRASLQEIYATTYDLGTELFLKVLTAIDEGKPMLPINNKENGSYYSWPSLRTVAAYTVKKIFKNGRSVHR